MYSWCARQARPRQHVPRMFPFAKKQTRGYCGSEHSHGRAAVDLDGAPGKELVLQDETDGSPDIFRAAETAERNAGPEPGEHLLGEAFEEAGLGDARSHAAE